MIAAVTAMPTTLTLIANDQFLGVNANEPSESTMAATLIARPASKNSEAALGHLSMSLGYRGLCRLSAHCSREGLSLPDTWQRDMVALKTERGNMSMMS